MAESRQFNFANFSRSTLLESITAAQTEIRVQAEAGALFPSASVTYDEIFAIIVSSGSAYEIMYVTEKDGDTFTVERAREGSTARAWSAGTSVVHNLTVGFLEQLVLLPPTAPVLSAELTAADEATLSWTASVPSSGVTITAYEIYRQVSSGGYFLLTSVAGGVLGYVDSGLLAGNQYDYYVIAIASTGSDSAASNVASVTVATPTYLMFGENSASATYDTDNGLVAGGNPGSASASIRGIAFSPVLGRWAICGTANGTVLTSDDVGATWTNRASGLGQNFEQMTYAHGAFWMGSNNGSCFTSSNAEAPWTTRMSGSRAIGVWYSPTEDRVACCGNLNSGTDTPRIFYADSLAAMSVASTTGLSSGGSDPGNTLYGIGRDDSRGNWWTANGNGEVFVTDDIVAGTWTLTDTIDAVGVSGTMSFAFEPNGAIVITTFAAGLWVSLDGGVTFTEREAGVTFRFVVWSDFFGMFFASGASGIYTSEDGDTWAQLDATIYDVIGEAEE